jgi:fructokinase
MTARPRALVIGEALIDVIERRDGTRFERPGGSPLNVAVGLGRLGDTVSFLTAVGADDVGNGIRSHLKSSGVALHPSSLTTARTSTATATLANDGSASYAFDIRCEIRAPRASRAPALVHAGSIAALLAPSTAAVMAAIESFRERALITFDPNIRERLLPNRDETRRTAEAFFRVADLVKLSDEDAHFLYPELEGKAVLDRIRSLGVATAVLTCGAKGWIIAGAGAPRSFSTRPTPVVDTVGAGDSYMAGLIHALLEISRASSVEATRRALAEDARTLDAASIFAARCAEVTVQRAGADLPWSRELATSG